MARLQARRPDVHLRQCPRMYSPITCACVSASIRVDLSQRPRLYGRLLFTSFSAPECTVKSHAPARSVKSHAPRMVSRRAPPSMQQSVLPNVDVHVPHTGKPESVTSYVCVSVAGGPADGHEFQGVVLLDFKTMSSGPLPPCASRAQAVSGEV